MSASKKKRTELRELHDVASGDTFSDGMAGLTFCLANKMLFRVQFSLLFDSKPHTNCTDERKDEFQDKIEKKILKVALWNEII